MTADQPITAACRTMGGPWEDLPVGLNPYRPHRRRPADLAIVLVALVVVAALVVWALLG